MARPDPKELEPGPATKRGRIEVRVVLAILVVFVVLGGLYVAVFGSPTRNRAAIDSSSSGPALVGGTIRTPGKPPH